MAESMALYGSLLILSNHEREELMRWAQSRTLTAGDVFRARLILALSDGISYRERLSAMSNMAKPNSSTIERKVLREPKIPPILAPSMMKPATTSE
jgi:hypothetical protein